MTTGAITTRLLHERIDINRLPSDLEQRVQAHNGKAWNTSHDGIGELRNWLLSEQRYRCAYCQLSIPAVSVGLCEFDHILPKAASAHCDPVKATANDFASRQHTFGYPAFTYTVRNLAVSCKQCNASKTSFDPLGDRSVAPTEFPISDAEYEWVHPHFVAYSSCIFINEDWLYSWLDKKGEHTIKACKLDQSEVLARRLASEALASQSQDLNHYLFLLIGKVDEIGHRDIARTLCGRFDLSEGLASQILDLWKEAPREFSKLDNLVRKTSALIGVDQFQRKPKMGLPVRSA
jgi:5-methylcytosine-specific restriction endonuclease McrA